MDLHLGINVLGKTFSTFFKGILLKFDFDNSFKGCTIIQSAKKFNESAVSLFKEINICEEYESSFRVHSDLHENELQSLLEPFFTIMNDFTLLGVYKISSITINNGQIFVAIMTNINIFKLDILTPLLTLGKNSNWYQAIVEIRQLAEKIKAIKPDNLSLK